MKNTFISRMKKFSEFISVSSNERGFLEYVKKEISPFVANPKTDIHFDAMGNLIAVMGKGCGEKVMFDAHADTIGFIAHYIDENGFVYITKLGGLHPQALTAREVVFANGVRGVLNFQGSKYQIDEAYVDIGASSRKDAEKRLPVGTVGTYVANVFTTGANDEHIVSPFMDDRIACAIEMAAMEKIAKEKIKLSNEIYFVFAVQEELGCRGAKTAAFGIEPKYGVALDVTATGDTPKCDPPMEMKLDGGACIKIMDSSVVCSKPMIDFMRNTAKKHNVAVQTEILPFGGTDTSSIQTAASGAFAGAVSIPTRYIHTPCETVSAKDCGACVDLICALVKEGFKF